MFFKGKHEAARMELRFINKTGNRHFDKPSYAFTGCLARLAFSVAPPNFCHAGKSCGALQAFNWTGQRTSCCCGAFRWLHSARYEQLGGIRVASSDHGGLLALIPEGNEAVNE
jgi:hypothetical protein